jgi:predicted metal-binding membrane protein
MMQPALPLRDRAVVLSGIILMAAIAWAYMWILARDSMSMCTVNTNPWGAADLLSTFLMWAVMMVAMMLPSASPMILAFAGVNRARRAKSLSYVGTAVFVLGYVAVWSAFSAAATAAQAALHSAALLSPMTSGSSRAIGGALLLAAGIFQWTPWKNACLHHCRTPLGFILTEWRDGSRGAFQMGWKHGFYCVGCCWLLMALLFVVGVMNLWWVAGIAAFVLVEKTIPAGPLIARAAGALLVACGLWMVFPRLFGNLFG